MKLSADDITEFKDQGYLFFPELFTKDEIAKLQDEVPLILSRSGPEIVMEKQQDLPSVYILIQIRLGVCCVILGC